MGNPNEGVFVSNGSCAFGQASIVNIGGGTAKVYGVAYTC
jgi:hypothetical protein